ncbi:acyl carrier protein [Micromonospora mirobrigensis]|uniref:Phosphopantetheine attachment site n=1 Tax=Micromonospora mirobrigensis TaxID=262898 RepID=A0A1C4ZZJ5_9ACTN|nr:acyl carrier protein [Micromonospora mirobrigensis]SCF38422.1 Phosphopantetheine attachment site [Micromonospora mirobrigensis]
MVDTVRADDTVAPPADSTRTPAVARIAALAPSERRDALEALVAQEVRTALLMTDDEELPHDVSYFDLGMTSLLITEVKSRLERLLGRTINANVLFNQPTVGRLLDHLAEDLLADVLVAPPAAPTPARAAAPADDRALVDDVLRDLYRA